MIKNRRGRRGGWFRFSSLAAARFAWEGSRFMGVRTENSRRGAGGLPARDADWLELARRLSACGSSVRQAMTEALLGMACTPAEFLLLWTCRDSERTAAGLGQIELARSVGLSPAQVSGLVERLRARGLLEGCRAARDRRRQMWRLTPSGRNTLADLLQAIAPRLAIWEAQLDGTSRNQLAALLAEWTKAVEGPRLRRYDRSRDASTFPVPREVQL
jgi:DNA-binding MarR family transcriptional regulator